MGAPESAAPRLQTVVWERSDGGRGHSFGRIAAVDDGFVCHGSEVLSTPQHQLACWFRILVDEQWITRAATVRAVDGDGERTLRLTADRHRSWTVNGVQRPELDGCLDVDVAATPLTNTFPIRRLARLSVGGSATTPVAWVDVPGLGVARVEQQYRRLGLVDGLVAWEYSDPEHGAFTLTVDADGLVVDYEGFARRIEPGS